VSCSFSKDRIEQAIAFHRHSCPGLAIGIRASEYCLHYFPDTGPADLVCVTETDMYAVDAIQFFTGCSTGKGNLIYRDYGKAAFTFYDRQQKKGYRFLFSPSFPDAIAQESAYLAGKKQDGTFSDEDNKRSTALREMTKQWLMECSLEEAFTVKEVYGEIPQRAPMAQSVFCDNCGEKTAAARTHIHEGKTICIPCHNKLQQQP